MNQWWCCNKAWLHFKVLVSQSFCVFAAGFGLMLRLLDIYSYIYIYFYNIKMHSSLLIFFLFFIFSYFLSFCGDIIVACKKTKKLAAAAVEKNLILPRHTLLTSIQSPAYHKKSKIKKKLQIYTFVYLNVICGINIITCFPTYNKIPTIFYYLPRKFIILKKNI